MKLTMRKLSPFLALFLGVATAASAFAAGTARMYQDPDEGMVLEGGVTKEVVIKETEYDAGISMLGGYDVVVLLDRSHSMARKDCKIEPVQTVSADYDPFDDVEPEKKKKKRGKYVSRWDWCRAQTLDLARVTAPVARDGLTLVTFSTGYNVYNNVGVSKIASAFASEVPDGNTETAAALQSQLDAYFERRERTGGKVKPLVVAIITDGAPTSAKKLRHVIADATRKMNKPDEINITFLQVGNDWRGNDLFRSIHRQLRKDGAVYDIVTVKPFSELQRLGLTQSLVQSITDQSRQHNGDGDGRPV